MRSCRRSRCSIPPGAKFQGQVEYAYFQNFLERTSNTLAGPFRGKLWTRIVLQACHEEPSLRSLVTSISALEIADRNDKRARSTLDVPDQTPEARKLYALEQYGQALSGVQAIALSGSPGALRKTLIASVLIYCFENMYAGVDAAVIHIYGAVQCLKKELARHKRVYLHSKPASPTPDLEDDLVAEFVRLDGGILGRPGGWGSTRQVYGYVLDCDFSNTEMPVAFTDSEEARNYLEHIAFTDLPQLIEMWVSALGCQQKPAYISASAVAGCKQMFTSHRRWLAAFRPVLRRAIASQKEGQHPIFEYSLQMKGLAAIAASQPIWAVFENPDEDPLPRHDLVSDCESILSLARIISSQPDFYRGFVWDCSMVNALFSVIMLAPRYSLRQEALEVMKSIMPRRENMWDSVMLAKAGELSLQASQTDEIVFFKNLRIGDPKMGQQITKHRQEEAAAAWNL